MISKPLFSEETLYKLALENHDAYINASPFPNIYFDNFFNPEPVSDALESFPTPESFNFYKYENALEKKLAFDQLSKLPHPIVNILQQLNSAPFLKFLEDLTGIDGLIPDPYYRGGGIHQILKGGKLDVHIDFNKHQKMRLDRRLNVLLYLNKDWEENYGGHFELWSGKKENGHHVLNKCEKRILPLFNRLAVFSTSERSYHGHPEPLTCPDGWSRKSIATYYYTNGRPEDSEETAHSTTFVKRPEDPDTEELNELRELRNQGRLSTNIKSNATS